MKHDFEKLFSLPWAIQRKGTWEHINSHNGEGLNICIMPYTDFEPKKAARQYLIQCSNLMPEAVKLLNEALRIIEKACIACANIDAYHCGLCGREETTREIKELLAKLEGGNDNEPR